MPRPVARVVTDIPTVENTDLSTSYASSAPSTYALDDKNILYYGSQNWNFCFKCTIQRDTNTIIIPFKINGIGNEIPLQELSTNDNNGLNIDTDNSSIILLTWLFVLNSNLIIWFPTLQSGLEIPYRSIILHAINGDKLYFQIQCNGCIIPNIDDNNNNNNNNDYDDKFIELYAIPIIGNDETYPLFKSFKNMDKNTILEKTYTSICECSSLFIDSTSEGEEEEEEEKEEKECDNDDNGYGQNDWSNGFVPSNGDDKPALISNIGSADDLNDDLEADGEEASGMDVDIKGAFSYSIKRKDNDNDYDDDKMYNSKNRKTN